LGLTGLVVVVVVVHDRFNGYRIDGSWLDVSILLQEFLRFISFSSVEAPKEVSNL
jgi:hypothetical protein